MLQLMVIQQEQNEWEASLRGFPGLFRAAKGATQAEAVNRLYWEIAKRFVFLLKHYTQEEPCPDVKIIPLNGDNEGGEKK